MPNFTIAIAIIVFFFVVVILNVRFQRFLLNSLECNSFRIHIEIIGKNVTGIAANVQQCSCFYRVWKDIPRIRDLTVIQCGIRETLTGYGIWQLQNLGTDVGLWMKTIFRILLTELRDAEMRTGSGARFSKAPIINGPVKLLLFKWKIEVLYISIWIFDFGPEKLPGLSRNGPQDLSVSNPVFTVNFVRVRVINVFLLLFLSFQRFK